MAILDGYSSRVKTCLETADLRVAEGKSDKAMSGGEVFFDSKYEICEHYDENIRGLMDRRDRRGETMMAGPISMRTQRTNSGAHHEEHQGQLGEYVIIPRFFEVRSPRMPSFRDSPIRKPLPRL